jgi:anti-sigma regulatory factor (Ser/Thr protein kinase)
MQPRDTITNAQMPDLDTEIDDLPEGGFGWALLDILCTKMHSKRRRSFNTLRLYFSKNNTLQRILFSHSN